MKSDSSVPLHVSIVVVLSLLRSAIGAQGIPPNPVLVGLALTNFDKVYLLKVATKVEG